MTPPHGTGDDAAPRDPAERLEWLYEEARQLPEAERAAFLDERCADDPALRAELESLLAHATEAESFMEALGRVGDPDAGSDEVVGRLNAALEGRYAIERRLGEGGMATVWLARDVRHQRSVALKILKPELAAIVGAERFLAEIRTTAGLQHPRILPLHDSGEVDGLLFFVTPYVAGESLRARLERERQLPVDDAVRIATEVADALDYAHRQGVIHRDVKPGNILLHEGRALVADFGIALAVGTAGGDRLTETGLSLGTPSYMSPEQATGEVHVGPATDIYALGCVLYEMLSGEPPYTGSTAQVILGKIITGTPDPLTAQRRSVPPHVDAAARKALEKLPADRFRTARDFAEALADPDFRHGDDLAAVAGGGGFWRGSAIALAGLALAAVATLLWALIGSEPYPPGAHFEVVLPDDLSVYLDPHHNVDVSPDGSSMVFTGISADGRFGLWLRRMDELRPVFVDGTENGRGPRFSPDGQWIAFVSEGDLRLVPPEGGPSRTVLPDAVTSFTGLSWGPDERIYFSRGGDGIWRTRIGGEDVEQILAPDPDGGVGYLWPEVLPNGKGMVFTRGAVQTWREAEILVVSLGTGQVTTLAQGQMARYARSGHLVYASAEEALLAAPFDIDGLTMGPARSLAERVEVRGSMAGYFAVSEAGTLVYLPETPPPSLELVWVTRTGEATPVDPDWRFVQGGGIWGFDLSPRADRVAVSAWADDNTDIWIKELPDGPFERLTFDVEAEAHPSWSPDGTFVTYWRAGDDAALWLRRADGTGAPEVLLEGGPVLVEGSWSPDGEWIVGRTTGNDPPPGTRDIVGFRPGRDAAPVPLVADPEVAEQNATLSPDGRWLAYSSAAGGRFDVYVSPFPDVESDRVQISNAGGMHPLWARSGRELYFWNTDTNTIVAAQIATDHELRVLRRQTLFARGPEYASGAMSSRIWAISPDDRRFLMARSAGASPPRRYVVDGSFLERLERPREGG